jgi:hypothetical protein
MRHVLIISVAAALLTAGMLYPYMPGSYDGLAVTISAMCQVFGIVGLVLAPLGLLWIAIQKPRRGQLTNLEGKSCVKFMIVSIFIGTLVALAVSVGALIDYHASFGVGFLVVCAVIALRILSRLRRCPEVDAISCRWAPVYIMLLPVLAALARHALVASAAESSRNRVISHSEQLIQEIENYRRERGSYPLSLDSLHGDYKPGVVGVERFHYELYGKAYNLYFQHMAVALDQAEIVLFNPRGENEFSSHDSDLLRFSPELLARTRGYVQACEAPQKNWKYFLFD